MYKAQTRSNQISHDAPKKSRFADEVGERYAEIEYIGVVKLYNDGVV